MARFDRLGALAIAATSLVACNLIAGIDQFRDVDEAGALDASEETGNAGPFDANGDTADEAGDAGVGAMDASDGSDAFDAADGSDATPPLDEAGSSPPPDGGPSVDYRWARWVMPNGADAGLPNPSSYLPIAALDGGVFDRLTGLRWGNAQVDVADAGGAGGACAYPWRLPTRIELVSILDTSQAGRPLVNPAFSTMQGRYYWTSSVNPQGMHWTVDFTGGRIVPSIASAVICVQSGDGGLQ